MKKTNGLLLILTVLLSFMLAACGTASVQNTDAVITPELTEDDLEKNTPSFSVLPGAPSQEEPEPQDDVLPEPEPLTEEERIEVYIRALLDEMTDAQLAGQMILAACPTSDANTMIDTVQPGGIILFSNNIDGQTPQTLSEELAGYQDILQIPMLVAVDEEGGSVARISRSTAFRAERFSSPRKLLKNGGVDALTAEMTEKAQLLTSLGINVNLAPVCDLATNEAAFMYSRALPGTVDEVCGYIEKMVAAMEANGLGTVLKHFPGYGDCGDTHTDVIIDDRPQETFYAADFLPFQAGIEAGSRAVLVSHNIVTAFDAELPASLSPEMLRVVREMLGEDVVAITDDLQMSAVSSRWTLAEAVVMAIDAGEDLVICFDGYTAADALTQAITDGRISRERAEESVRRILLWKIELGLLGVPEEITE